MRERCTVSCAKGVLPSPSLWQRFNLSPAAGGVPVGGSVLKYDEDVTYNRGNGVDGTSSAADRCS